MSKKVSPAFIFAKGLIRFFYLKMEVVGTENLPDEPCIVAANHTQMNGPIACELYFPGSHYTWCAGEMMSMKDVPAYAFKDFWFEKPRATRWMYKILSYLIAPLSAFIFQNANTIGVYHDTRILTTFRNTLSALQDDANVIIFPEEYKPHNHILYNFQEGFIDIARFYFRKTGKALPFVPMYIAPRLKKMFIGKPICFNPENQIETERRRICDYLMDEITKIARALPEHTVIPYRNIPRKLYPTNISPEVNKHEKTSC